MATLQNTHRTEILKVDKHTIIKSLGRLISSYHTSLSLKYVHIAFRMPPCYYSSARETAALFNILMYIHHSRIVEILYFCHTNTIRRIAYIFIQIFPNSTVRILFSVHVLFNWRMMNCGRKLALAYRGLYQVTLICMQQKGLRPHTMIRSS